MELVFRRHFDFKTMDKLKTTFLEKLTNDDKVSYYWSVISNDWCEDDALVLLKLIAKKWITIRGFSAASAFIEMYKKSNKRTVQKSKGLRKTLIINNDSTRD